MFTFLASAILLLCQSAQTNGNDLVWTDAGYDLPEKINAAVIAEFDNIIYLLGGSGGDNGGFIGKVFKLDLSETTPIWVQLSGVTNSWLSTLTCAGQCSTTIDDRYIYIYNGNYFTVFDSVIEDFIAPNVAMDQSDRWGCIVTDNTDQYIYKIGEYTKRYDVKQNVWTTLTQPPYHSPASTSCVFYPPSNSFFVFPFDYSPAALPILEYDITNDVWSVPNPAAKMTNPKFNTRAVLVNDMVYIIGGEVIGLSLPTKDVDAFNPINKEMTSATSLNKLSAEVNVVVVGGDIYAFGGYENSQLFHGYLDGSEVCKISLAPPRTLILRHQSTSKGLFDPTLYSTGLENENDPTQNTYSIIGNIDTCKYKSPIDNKYEFKLVYHNFDGSTTILEWKQSSWLNEAYIRGYEPVNIPDQTTCPIGSGCRFYGLGGSNQVPCYLDGEGVTHGSWYNAVGITQSWDQNSIPGFNRQKASGQELYILDTPRYIIGSQQMSCDQAKAYCKSQYGTTLAIIRDASDYNLAISVSGRTENVWIGLERAAEIVNPWKWADGLVCDIYGECNGRTMYWAPGEPSVDGGWNVGQCAGIYAPPNNKYNDWINIIKYSKFNSTL